MIFTDAVQSSTQEYSKVNTFKEVSEITILAEPIDVIARIGTYINFCVKVEANNPTFQWYDKYGSQMPRMCKSNLTIGPVKEEDFGFYRLHIIDQKTGQTVLTRWTELKKAQPRVTQSDRNEYQQVEPSLIRTEPLPQSSPVQEKRKIYTEYQHKPRQQCSNISGIIIIAEPIDSISRIGSYVNFSAKVEATNPTYQWYDKDGNSISGKCRNNLTIGPVKEEDFGFYQLGVRDGRTNQIELTRWTELKKAQPRVTQSDRNEYQQVEPSLIRTEPLPQSSPVQEKRKIYTECQHKPRQQCSNISGIIIIAEPIDSISRIGSYVNFSAKVEATNPTYQWYDKDGNSISGKCRNNLTIGPVKEEDFGFYQLGVRDGRTNQIELTRWTELKKAQPRLTQSDKNEYQQVEPSLIRTEPLPQSSPVQEKRKIYTEYLSQHQLEQLTPKLLMQPEGGAYSRGSRITLTAHFENATHYQWCKDGVKLEGCVGNTLVINNANLGNTGNYDLCANNNFSSIYSRTRIIIY